MADQLKRIADKLDGGDPNVGTPSEEGNLKRIADYIVENGMGGGSGGTLESLIVEMTMSEDAGEQQIFTLNKTWKEISDAMLAGITVLIHEETSYGYSYSPVIKLNHIEFGSDNSYDVTFWDSVSTRTLATDTQNGYPFGE